MRFLWSFTIFMLHLKLICTQETFELRFQSSGKWSKDEWAEHKAKIPPLENMTVCHWEKRQYLSVAADSIWAYCSIKTSTDSGMKCVQLLSEGNVVAANRKIGYRAWFSGWTKGTITSLHPLNYYRHRAWNHVCWVYSGLTGISKLYHNGILASEKLLVTRYKYPTIAGHDAVFDDAFVIGQEPDSLRGDFTEKEAFFGSIAELHLWDRLLKDDEIKLLLMTASGGDYYSEESELRQAALTHNIPVVTTFSAAKATVKSLQNYSRQQIDVKAIQEYYK